MSYVAPQWHNPGYTCPHCRIYAQVTWADAWANQVARGNHVVDGLEIASCHYCRDVTLWLNKIMIFPDMLPVENPNPDLAPEIQADYQEAALILNRSPRSSMALLRLCVQKLCKQLGKKGENINEDIADLVKDGLSVKIQQALDSLRVTGNNAVHPGTMNLADDTDTATQLFAFLNLIAKSMVSEPKAIEAAYNSLPAKALDAIKKRDGVMTPKDPSAPGAK